MNLQDKINLALESGRIEGAKKLLSMLVQQEHKSDWDKAKREEYELLFPAYYPLEQEFVFADDDMYKWRKAKEEDGFEITLFDTERQYAEYRKAIDYTDNVDYVTYDDWLNETKVITPEVVEVSHLEWVDGEQVKIIDTPYESEVTELIRPYIGLTDVELGDEVTARLHMNDIYLEYLKKLRDDKVKSIVVTTAAGNVFQGDEVSQNRMVRAITALSVAPVDTTIIWTLADNTKADVTKEELAEALLLAGQAQTEVW